MAGTSPASGFEWDGWTMKITAIEAFRIAWAAEDNPEQRSAFVIVRGEDGVYGIGEASPMQGGLASLGIVAHNLAPELIGKDPLDHAVLLDAALHKFVKLGPEGALTGALAALDIALWDLKGKLLGQPIYKLLGGAWRTSLPFYASIGGNGVRSVDEVLHVVEARLKDNPAAVKIRFDNDRTRLDSNISAGEQTYTLAGVADLIAAGVRMVQPDIVKMGGITGLQRCAALAHAHGVELVPHQTQPTIGHVASLHVAASQLHATKPCEWNDPSPRTHAVFENPPTPIDGLFRLPQGPGLGLTINETELARRRVP